MKRFSNHEILRLLKGMSKTFSDLDSFRLAWLMGLFLLKEAPISLLYCAVRMSVEYPEIKKLKENIVFRLGCFPDRVAELICEFIEICEKNINHPEAYEKVKTANITRELIPLLIKIKKTGAWPITLIESSEELTYKYPVFVL